MIGLINDIRLRAGKPVLGFFSPTLYSTKPQAALDDVTNGESGGCSWDTGFETGWEALKGWDAATGLGTLNFSKLRTLLS